MFSTTIKLLQYTDKLCKFYSHKMKNKFPNRWTYNDRVRIEFTDKAPVYSPEK